MKAYELLDKREKWIQGAFARDMWGRMCSPQLKIAETFCMAGAIERCYNDYLTSNHIIILKNVEKVKEVLKRRYGVINITEWNDDKSRTYEQVIDVLKEADV